ncbi:TFC4 [Candida pseudojiufengensis]|uniref:TFC4 n=1 Tax=Candida pseudojiufengensis TaxID=497109 RepID=UPI002223FFF7|nr:TFC4 [Candida pseudojiufengensis]KAI5966460.1 TFC4 [Candida pseudojiufengensis]
MSNEGNLRKTNGNGTSNVDIIDPDLVDRNNDVTTLLADQMEQDNDDEEDKLDKALNELDMAKFGVEEDDMDIDDDGDGNYYFEQSDGDFDDDDDDFLQLSGEDDYDDDYDFKDALKGASNFKVRNRREKLSKSNKSYFKKRMARETNRELDPEVRMNLSMANEAFVRNDLQVAQQLYKEVIKGDPRNFSAYKSLGEIYKTMGKLNECCSSWLLAANLHPWDTEFWGQVAELSVELEHIDQAIYCYTRAITPDTNKSAKYILERALLYKEKKSYGKSLDGFQRLRQLWPKNSNIIKYLASVYVDQKRLNDAINLYMRILDSNIQPDPTSDEIYPDFGWPELNILLELHMQHRSFKLGINVLKLAARWIQGRMNENSYWDEDADDEFDAEKRFKNKLKLKPAEEEAFNSKPYELPIDIRFKLGLLRLGLDQKDEALGHLNYLLIGDQEEIADLFYEAGKNLSEFGYYEEAVTFLEKASAAPGMVETDLVSYLGKCYFEVGDYEGAEHAFSQLLNYDRKNVDYKLALAETLYHLGDDAQAKALIKEVKRDTSRDDSVGDEIELEEQKGLSIIKNKVRKTTRKRYTEQEKLEMEANATSKVLEKYRRMERLQEAINEGDRVAISAWIQLASQLIEMFTNVKSFFPKDKSKKFKGILRYRSNTQMNLDDKLARAYNLLEGINEEQPYSKQILVNKTEYRGITYDQWFDIFAQFALVLSIYESNSAYAIDIINIGLAANIFAHDKAKESILRLLKFMFVYSQPKSFDMAFQQVRVFLLNNQFSPFMCQFFLACCSLSAFGENAHYNHQKFFLRQLKSYDYCYKKEEISGRSNITADLTNVDLGPAHLDIIYIYATLLGGNKSYSSVVFYINRAYKYFNKDPMLCLLLGLAHVHRSMQRLSTNRNIQLLQGLSIFLEYRDNRLQNNSSPYERQEVEYNFGRLFHMLGLTSLAVEFYNKVLEISKNDIEEQDEDVYDLKWEAAYNLQLIYTINGNNQLAKEIIEEYLVI